MINLPLPEDNPFERLVTSANIGDLIAVFGNRLNEEPYAVTSAVRAMEENLTHSARHHAESWGRVPHYFTGDVRIELNTTAVTPTQPIQEIQALKPEYIATPVKPKDVNRPVTSIEQARARIASLHDPVVDNQLSDKTYYAEAA